MSTSGASGLPQVTRRAPAAPPPASPVGPSRPVFGSRDGLAKLVAKNALLTVVTFGFYRFWARTALRRFYWSNVAIAGERFEYTGTGAELFVGFLIAMMVLAPVLAGFTILQLLLEPDSIAAMLMTVAYGAGIYVFIATALFRARRYRLSRTRWRGIRFVQDGSTWRFIGLTLGWTAVVAVTLGLGFPWLRWAQQRYMMRCTSFGDRRFSFEGSPRALLWPWLLVLACFVLPLVIAAALGIQAVLEIDPGARTAEQETGESDLSVSPTAIWRGMLISGTMMFAFIAGGLAFLNYRIAEFRLFAAATRLGDVTVRSEARVGPVVGAAFRGLLCFLAGMVVLPLLGILVAVGSFLGPVGTVVFGALGAVLMLVLFIAGTALIVELVVRFAILRHVATTLELSDLGSLEAIVQSAAASPRVGEGLADAFDIGTM